MPVKVVRPEDRNLRPAEEGTHGNVPSEVRQAGAYEVVSTDPYVHIARMEPNSDVPAHSHSEAEVMVVLSGTVRVGDVDLTEGSVAVIPPHEEYSLDVQGDGLTFLVVRSDRGEYQRGG